MAKATNNPQGDTAKVDRNVVLLGYTLKKTKATIDPQTKKRTSTPGNTVTITNTIRLYLPENLIKWFDIPTFTPSAEEAEAAQKRFQTSKVGQFQYTKYKAIDDATGTTVIVPEHDRALKQGSGGRTRKSAYVVLGENKKTAKGNPRTVNFGFPSFFNIVMIGQALGSMIRTTSASKKPLTFTMTKAGTTYYIPYNTATAALNGRSSGAWVATSELPLDPSTDNIDNVPGNVTIISSAGDQDGEKP